jgi:nitrite reductase (NADH) small subunit
VPGEQRHVACAAEDLAPGRRRIVEIDGRSIGVFNIDGRFYALHNGCPHKGGPLCEGRVGGTTLIVHDRTFAYGREGQILRCAWHGWEFEIETGRSLVDPRIRAKTFPVTVEDGDVVVHIG